MVHVLDHRGTEVGQALGEPNQAIELRLLLLGAEICVVQVLAPPRRVDTGCLQLRGRAG